MIARDPRLTSREWEVMVLVGDHWTDSEIGARLGLSTRTVNHIVERVLEKVGVGRRGQACDLLGIKGPGPMVAQLPLPRRRNRVPEGQLEVETA